MITRLTVRWERLVGALALIALCTGASAQTTITVGPPPPAPNGEVGIPYTLNLTATETPPATCCTWSATGLPASLNISGTGTSAQITGTPGLSDANTVLNVTVTAADTVLGLLINGSQTYSITIFPQLQITTTTLSGGTQGVPYSASLTATGGNTSAYSWSLGTVTPPAPWLSLSSGGSLGGTPLAGAYSVPVQLTDGLVTVATTLTLVISPPALVVQTASLPSGEASAPYSPPSGVSLSATGGSPPYTWSVTGLPMGI